MKKSFNIALLSIFINICFISCEKASEDLTTPPEEIPINIDNSFINLSVSNVPVYSFDWDNVDWMPTPPGQSRISPPWVGQGSLLSFYGLEILNDHKASDGWVLVYSTFDPSAPASIANPYFILYNKYRGLLRIYFYLTESSFVPSAYLQDGLFIKSSHTTSMLNFLGQDMVDATENQQIYTQNQPVVSDGSKPLASNRWYMMQYEIAYDPNLSQIPSNSISMNWYLNYCNISNVSLGGTTMNTLYGTIGAASTSSSNILSKFSSKGSAVGVGVLAGVGKEIIDSNTINATTGENKLGLPKDLFKNVAASVEKAYINLPDAAIDLLSTVFGGSSNGPTPVCLNLKTNIDLKGSITNLQPYSSNPISLPVPGTQGKPIYGVEPLYNETLGVICFTGKPTISIDVKYKDYTAFSGVKITKWTEYTAYFPSAIDYSSCLIINPKVLEIANVTIQKQDLVLVASTHYHDSYDTGLDSEFNPEINPSTLFWYEGTRPWRQDGPNGAMDYPSILKLGVRFTIKVEPKDGSPASTIIKTFQLNYKWNYIKMP